jgi:hypothetical protein
MVGSVGVDGLVVVVSAGGLVSGFVVGSVTTGSVPGFSGLVVGSVVGSVVGFVAGSVVGSVTGSVTGFVVEVSVGVTTGSVVAGAAGVELEESSPQPAITTEIKAAQITGKALQAINFFIFIVFSSGSFSTP